MKLSLPSSSPSFALISVLALVSLAALTATAFLASARLERQATRSIGSQTQLDMALSSGMECAAQTINIMCEPKWNTTAVYWRGTNINDWTNEIGYLLLGRPNSPNNVRWTYFCGFSPAVFKNIDSNSFLIEGTNLRQDSYLTDIGDFMTNMTNGFIADPAATNTNCTRIPLLGGRTSPPVGWVYIFQPKPIAGTTNTTNTPVARFAYFMEDLQGYIDAERMGGLTNRDTGTNPQEICLTNLGLTNTTNFCNSNNRIKYLSPGMMMYAGGISSSNLAYVATHLLSWTNAPQFVPCGVPVSSAVGYSNAGYNKTNLNTVATSTNSVSILAGIISNNIASFASTRRSGAMSGGAYLSNIAANIVDYIDADSTPTVDSASPPAWRGCELIAWPNEIFTRIHLEGPGLDTKPEAGGFTYSFKLKHYLEVWNINNSNVPVDNLVISNNRSFPVRIPPLTFNLNTLGTNSSLPLTPVAGSPATLRPGEFGMLETPTITLRTSISGAVSITNVQFLDGNQNSSVIYTATGNEISRTKMGSLTYNKDIVAANPYGVSSGVNFATALSYAVQSTYRAAPPNLKSIGGDPRATMFLGTWPTKGMLYSNYSSPGGLNWEYGNRSFSNGYVNAKDLWPDGGRYKSTDLGVNPTSYGTSPEIHYLSKLNTWSTNVGLARVRNGPLSNICELGNIFDPLQWEDSNQLPPAAGGMPGLWTNLSSSAVPSDTAGGRNTLRIGRAEFQRFAFTNYGTNPPIPNMGLSASALLDIFCTTNNFNTGGQINLNTAPAPVLRALALGINLKSDPALLVGGGETNNYPIPADMAEAFAQGVMRFRSKYPFLSPSQLTFIGTDNNWPNTTTWPSNSVFGNTNIITLTNIPGSLASSANIRVSEWNDQAAEEWFSKIYQLSTVQSFNYRVYVVAQLVGTNLMPKGPMARKYYHLYLRNNSTTAISAGPYMNYQSAY
jgi:hypothetical protein